MIINTLSAPVDAPKLAFSERFNDALAITAIVDEMLRADNWQGIDECLAIKPDLVKTFTRYAEAALRAIKQIGQHEGQVVHFKLN